MKNGEVPSIDRIAAKIYDHLDEKYCLRGKGGWLLIFLRKKTFMKAQNDKGSDCFLFWVRCWIIPHSRGLIIKKADYRPYRSPALINNYLEAECQETSWPEWISYRGDMDNRKPVQYLSRNKEEKTEIPWA